MKSFLLRFSKSVSWLSLVLLIVGLSLSNSYAQVSVNGTNYSNLGAAFTALNAQVHTGAITILITSNTTEPSRAFLDGTLASITSLTIRPSGGDRSITGSFNEELIRFENVSNVTIDGSTTVGGTTRNMTIGNNNTGLDANSIIFHHGSNNTIKNSNIRNGSSNVGIAVLLSNVSNTTVENCWIYKAQIGIHVQNNASDITITKNDIGSTVTNDKIAIRGISFVGGLPNSCDGFEISYNNVHGIYNTTLDALIMGIIVWDAINGSIIGNRVNDVVNTYVGAGTAGAFAVRIGTGSTETGRQLNVLMANNTISNVSCAENYVAALNLAWSQNVQVYHNTFSLSGTSTAAWSFAIFIYPLVTNTSFNNNIVDNQFNASSNMICYVFDATNPFTTINNNAYNKSSAANHYYGYFNAFATTLQDWRTAINGDANSVEYLPEFVGTSNFHLAGSAIGIANARCPRLAAVSTDMDGETRTVTTTYKGADEIIPQVTLSQNLTQPEAPYCQGDEVVLEVIANKTFGDGVARNTNEPIDFDWYKDGGLMEDVTSNQYLIRSINSEDDGYYRVTSTFMGSSIQSNIINLTTQAEINLAEFSPASYVCEGGDALLINANATGTITGYQWQKENPETRIFEDLPGQIYAMLNISLEDASQVGGKYRVIVYGPGVCGPSSITSNTTEVFVSYPLTDVMLHPNIPIFDACTGDDIILEVTAEGTILGYQWQYLDNGIWRNFTIQENASARSDRFVMEQAKPEHSKTVRCVVFGSESCGTTSIATDQIHIEIRPISQLINQPETQIICYGQNAHLMVLSDGDVASYQWQKDGKDITLNENPSANQPVFMLFDAIHENSGVYRCKLIVRDCQGPQGRVVYSDNALIYVLRDTRIISLTDLSTVKLGDDVTLEVIAHAIGAPQWYMAEVQWYRNNQKLQDNDRISGSKSSLLTIKKINEADLGSNYHVLVTGHCGTAEAHNITIVAPRVNFVTNVSDANVCEGQNIIFQFDAELIGGATDYSVQWFNNGIPLNESAKYTGVNTPVLAINDVNAQDISNNYYAQLTLKPGDIKANTRNASLYVKEAPKFAGNDIEYDLPEGNSFQYIPTITGEEPMTFQWYFNGEVLEGANDLDLFFARIEISDAGTYYLEATNECGSTQSYEITINVITGGVSAVSDFVSNGLLYNEPNPFNEQTTIKFDLLQSGFVELAISDVYGKEVNTIVSKYLEIGNHQFVVNSSELNLAAGVYFYTLRINGLGLTKSMILVK